MKYSSIPGNRLAAQGSSPGFEDLTHALDVGTDLAHEVLGPREAARVADLVEEVEEERRAVQIAGEVEQMHLDARLGRAKGNVRPDVCRAAERVALDADAHGIHAVAGQEVRDIGEVGGGEAEGASSLLSADHGTEE